MKRLVFNTAEHKLEELEKYGIKNIRQLDARLSGEDKSHKSAIIWHNKYNEIKNELNVWKRALTKAVLNLRLSQIGHISLVDKFKTGEDLENYFYQQAKKELTNNYKVLGVDTNENKENE